MTWRNRVFYCLVDCEVGNELPCYLVLVSDKPHRQSKGRRK